MTANSRRYSLFDKLIQNADQALRTLVPGAAQEERPSAVRREVEQLRRAGYPGRRPNRPEGGQRDGHINAGLPRRLGADPDHRQADHAQQYVGGEEDSPRAQTVDELACD